ncbi:hypothetical protein KC887_01565 [Candidatus Kaiserbacteria bacterium]|nr:hypothetical protein [Candidatus Kaiserbacteria bacterium]
MNPIQIVATIGPACAAPETLCAMVSAGMSLARLNFSWGTHAEHGQFIRDVRQAARAVGVTVPIIQDISGPRVQAGSSHTFNAGASVVTEKDRADVAALAPFAIEYVAQSFVASAADVGELRQLLGELGSSSKIIAKIERREALEALDEIIAAADGIMIARGDLGEAVPYETLPFVKKDILLRCNEAGVPAIVATEFLTSMIEHDHPSRADVSDITAAVLDGASAVMLSNETAVGKYPIDAVTVMRTVVDEAQQHASEVLPRL